MPGYLMLKFIVLTAVSTWSLFPICGLGSGLKKNVILYYGFENVTGKTVIDESGQGNAAVIINNISQISNNTKCGRGVDFHDGHLNITLRKDWPTSNLSKSSFDLTIALWVWIPEFEAHQSIFTSYNNEKNVSRLYHFGIRKGGNIRWFMGIKSETGGEKIFDLSTNDKPLKPKQWYHLAATYASGKNEASIFVNGTMSKRRRRANRKIPNNLPDNLPHHVGWAPTIGSFKGKKQYYGIMDEYYIFSKALNKNELSKLLECCKADCLTEEDATKIVQTEKSTPATKTSPTTIVSTEQKTEIEVTITPTTTIPTVSEEQESAIPDEDIEKAHNIKDKSEAKSFLLNLINKTFPVSISRGSDNDETNVMEFTRRLETIGLILAHNVLKVGESVSLETESVVLQMSIPTSGFSFPSAEQESSKKINETLTFPDEIFEKQGQEPRAVVCMAFANLHRIMPKNVTISSDFLESNTTVELNSKIVGAAVQPSLTRSLDHPIEITFIPELVQGRQNCSFWNYSIKTTNGKFGQWSTQGCEVNDEKSSPTKTVCKCNHLTNFALLLQRDGDYTDPPLSLKVVTIIGSSLSVLASFLCFVMFLTFRKKDIRHYLHINLSFAIAISHLILLFGIRKTEHQALCKAIAVFLHYFYLVAFLLMLSEGVHLTMLIETAFQYGNLKLPVYLIGSWGLPLLIVGITLAARFDSYGGKNRCFVSAEEGAVYAFAGPFALVLAINFVVLLIVIRQVIRKTSLPTSSKVASKVAMARASVKSLAILFPVLGLTWIFGILYFGFQTLAFEYLFGIFCSLQGFFIFLFQYALNTESKTAFLRATQRWCSSTARTKTSRRKSTGHHERDFFDNAKVKEKIVEESKQQTCQLLAPRQVDEVSGLAIVESRTVSTLV